MSIKLLSRHEGFLEIDHRASPGIPEHLALELGLNPKHVAGGKLFESATLSCKHCGGAWLKNPDRTRERGYCRKCDHYICDACKTETLQANYTHRTREDIMDAALTAAAHCKPIDLEKPTTIYVP